MLLVIAVLLAPVAMSAPAAAVTTPQPTTAQADGHCAGAGQSEKEQSQHKADCVIACSAVVAERIDLPFSLAHKPALQRPLPSIGRAGSAPEAATPPPRS